MDYLGELAALLPPERLKTRLLDRHAYARDASFYRLVPQAVVEPTNEREVVSLLNFSRRHRLPLVFRGAGTSLSGQAITDGILAVIGRHWRDYRIADDASTITLEPGIIGAVANQYLHEHGRKIGPDPASINACFIGGMLANNASGMCCGVVDNAYHTLESLRFVLPSGLTFDTALSDADDRLAQMAPELHQGLLKLRQRILDNTALRDRIRDRYERKNTLGYSLNAFLDFERPIDILAHLMIGSEGTLGFISEATLRTLPDPPHKSTGLLLFDELTIAADATVLLKEAGAAALEIMDRASLRAVEREPGMPPTLADLPQGAAALLCEFQDDEPDALADRVADAANALGKLKLLHEPGFTAEARQRALYWKIRKGLFPAVGAVRKTGTTVIIEDICFRGKDLAPAVADLQGLFKEHKYWNAIVFGHAKEGNLHFVISQPFNDEDGIARYDAFMNDVVEMTVGKYDGALKAEHGTGRNMAPFVATEWGPEGLAIMRELKTLVDPDNLLNPGVIVNDNPRCHVEHVKPLTPVHDLVDTCIECGFCERWCPSRDLTMTPRRRIAAAREIAFLRQGTGADKALAAQLQDDLPYESVETCATDGLCALGCPVKIDTGKLVKELRAWHASVKGRRIAAWTVDHFALTATAARLGLKSGHLGAKILGPERVMRISQWLSAKAGGQLPQWRPVMPAAAGPLPPPRHRDGQDLEEIVYFPSCLTRGLGALPGEHYTLSPTEAFMDLLREADIHAVYPDDLESLCCGQAYSSKGYVDSARKMIARTVDALHTASRHGRLPIVIDTSPCSYRLKTASELLTGNALKQWQQLRILDIIEFLHDILLERVMPTELPVPAVLHPVCSVEKMGLRDKLVAVAQRCAVRVIIPEDPSCCGFAGDRGFLHPELTQSATRDESAFVKQFPPNARHLSTCRTCELGMTAATGRTYSSLIHLVHEAVCTR